MKISNLLGFKPVVLSFKSPKKIDIVHEKISNATDAQFNYVRKGKSKFFYGQIKGNDFNLFIYTSSRLTGKANTKIVLNQEENGTRINIRLEFSKDLLYILFVFMGISLIWFLGMLYTCTDRNEVLEVCGFFIAYIGFSWLIQKFSYSLTIDLSKKTLYKILRYLELR